MWKTIFRITVLLLILYFTRPLWEKYTTDYINLDFLQPVDAKVEQWTERAKTSEWPSQMWESIKTNAEDVYNRIRGVDKKPVLEEVTAPSTETLPSTVDYEGALSLGIPHETILDVLGEPKRTLLNEYQTLWHVYHEDYNRFTLIAYDQKNEIAGLYTNSPIALLSEPVQYGQSKEQVRRVYGKPLTEMTKGRTIFVLQENEGLDVFQLEDRYIYAFYDEHRNHTLTALLVVAQTLEKERQSMYVSSSQSLRNSYEQLLFELTNAVRVREGKSILRFHDALASTARKHSIDMAKNDYFSHTNLQGESPFERMRKDRIHYTQAGENLAYGQFSPIFAHEGLMNSYDHRMNTLTPKYTTAGIGVAFNDDEIPYFTQLFLKE